MATKPKKAVEPAQAPRKRLSEGVREELARLGHANDPATGEHLWLADESHCPACAEALAEARRSRGITGRREGRQQ